MIASQIALPKSAPDVKVNLADVMNVIRLSVSMGLDPILGGIWAFKDKDVKSMIFETTDLFKKIITVEPKSKRAMPLEKLTKIASEYNGNVLACQSVDQAIHEALKNTKKNDCIVMFGSFSIMSAAKISLKSIFNS